MVCFNLPARPFDYGIKAKIGTIMEMTRLTTNEKTCRVAEGS